MSGPVYTFHLTAQSSNTNETWVALCGANHNSTNLICHISSPVARMPEYGDSMCDTCLLLSLEHTNQP